MRAQRRIVYITGLVTVISVALYFICIFLWNPVENTACWKWNTFSSNIALALFGSALLSLIVAYLSYCDYKTKALERFKKTYRDLFNLSGQYGKRDSYEEWFKAYCNLCEELGDIWADIWFLLDPNKHRLYLKSIIDYYMDLITMTQGKFRILSDYMDAPNNVRDSVIQEIDKYVIYDEELDRGALKIHVRHNRLTEGKEFVFKNIDEIYRNRKLLQKYSFQDTLVKKTVFTVLTPEQEGFVKKICEKIKETNSCEIKIRIPENIAIDLQKAGYVSGFSTDKDGVCGLSCNFIIDHYFALKERLSS